MEEKGSGGQGQLELSKTIPDKGVWGLNDGEGNRGQGAKVPGKQDQQGCCLWKMRETEK